MSLSETLMGRRVRTANVKSEAGEVIAVWVTHAGALHCLVAYPSGCMSDIHADHLVLVNDARGGAEG